MASDEEVGAVIAFLHELFPTREIGEHTLDAWATVFADWRGDELRTCAAATAREPGRVFFPTPGEIAAHRTPAVVDVVDAAKLLREIEKLGVPHPAAGWLAPQVGTVREKLGGVIADAYAAAGGGPRVFSADETTRAIAYREFHKNAVTFAALPVEQRPELLPGVDRKRITSSAPEALANVLTRALPPGAAA